METRGAVDIANVDQALYRDDLGFKVTQAGYEEYKRGEGLFGKAYDEIISSNTSALEQNRAGLQTINDFLTQAGNESIDKWYQNAQQGWVDVVVAANTPFETHKVEARNGAKGAKPPGVPENAQYVTMARQGFWKWQTEPTNKIQYSMKLPKEVADQLAAQMPTGADDKYGSKWWGDKLYIGDAPGGGDNRYGKELNEALVGAQNQVKSAFYDAALPKYQELVANVGKAQESKSQYEQYIKTSEDTIADANQQKALRDTTKEAYKQQYTESKAARQALFAPIDKPEETL
jgi:hypothetical protein